MAVNNLRAGTVALTTGTAPAPALPAGLLTGDVLFCWFYSKENVDGTVAISAGWNQLVNTRDANGGLLGVWWRAWQAGDAAPTLTLTNHTTGVSGDSAMAQIVAVAGADTATQPHVQGTVSTWAVQEDMGPISGVTTTVDGCLILVIGGRRSPNGGTTGRVATLSGEGLTWTEIAEYQNTNGSDAGGAADYAPQPTQGAIAAKTFDVLAGTTTGGGKGVIIAVKPVPTGPASYNRSTSDSAPAADTPTRTFNAPRATADSAPAVDSATRVASYPRAVSESGPATDTPSRSIAVGRGVTDTAPATDAPGRLIAVSRGVADDSPAVDSPVGVKTVTRATADDAPATDAPTRVLGLLRGASDAAPATDTASRVIALIRGTADAAPATDAVTRLLALFRGVGDTAPGDDSVGRALIVARSTSDAAPAVDSAEASRGSVVQISEFAPASDAPTRVIGLSRSVVDAAPAEDLPGRLIAVARSVIDAALAADAAERLISVARGVIESAPADVLTTVFGSEFPKRAAPPPIHVGEQSVNNSIDVESPPMTTTTRGHRHTIRVRT